MSDPTRSAPEEPPNEINERFWYLLHEVGIIILLMGVLVGIGVLVEVLVKHHLMNPRF